VTARVCVLRIQNAFRVADHPDLSAAIGVFTEHQATEIDSQLRIVTYVPFGRFRIDSAVNVFAGVVIEICNLCSFLEVSL
jgi:hypothetical protein